MEELLWQLVEVAQNVAPELWQIAMRQVQVQAILVTGIAMFCFTLCMVCVGLCVRFVKNSLAGAKESYWDDNFAVPCLGALVTLIATLIFAGMAVARTMNPAYYAIKILLNLM